LFLTDETEEFKAAIREDLAEFFDGIEVERIPSPLGLPLATVQTPRDLSFFFP
jgi:hypothetical protein